MQKKKRLKTRDLLLNVFHLYTYIHYRQFALFNDNSNKKKLTG